MEDEEEYSKERLERCSYRLLQQTAKGLGLPSNVKKVYLIQLIYTQKYRSKEEVDELVKKVRLERRQMALVRKRVMGKKKQAQLQQSAEISSTSNSKSPPITNTPKRVGHILIRYSPEIHSPIKYPRTMPARSYPITSSDRVLRSFNRVKNPSYLLNNTMIGLIQASGSEERSETRVNIVSKEEKYRKINRTYVRKNVEDWQRSASGQIMPIPRSANISPPLLARRQQRLSGIYPLNPEEMKQPNVSVRRADGTLSKLNAIIQKPLTQHNYNYEHSMETRNQLLSIEAEERPLSTPNIQENPPNITVTDIPQNSFNFSSSSETSNSYKENNEGEFSVYYHKKIRAEQVRTLKSREPVRCMDNESRLPKINEVFSKFNSVYCKDLTQPIYVQVDNEPEIVPNLAYIPEPQAQYSENNMLEKLYNLKSVYNQRLLQIATTDTTRTVYSTPIISTAKPQPSASAVHNVYNIASSRDNQPYFTDEELPRVHDFFRNFRCDDENIHDVTSVGFRRSDSSTETINSQELGANVTIPEMVEDALELISQDGDYMERMGMDIRMQCILCNWAGPKIILEYHIRKEHSSDIVQCDSVEWCCTYTLGSLWRGRRWLSRLLELRGALLVLSTKYEDPDYFMAALTTLSSDPDIPKSGRMTIYNKVTGEPFTWEGPITQLPPSMPYDNDPNCFKLQLSRMDLLPNSANLKLLNRELVIRSPTKVVVGQPELDNIHINLIVKILE